MFALVMLEPCLSRSPQRLPLLALRYASRFDELPSRGLHRAPSTFQEQGRHTVHATALQWHVMRMVVGCGNQRVSGAFAGV